MELYLNGQLGAQEDVTAQQASVLYAVDRFCAAPKIREWLSAGEAVLSNRYTSANLGHQGAKIKDSMERRIFWEWNLWFEYDFMKIPRPCKTILLMVQPEIAFELIGRKSERGYLAGKKRDIHEDDLNFLKASYDSFHELAAVYPEDFEVITCDDGTNILPESVITGMIWRQIFTYFF